MYCVFVLFFYSLPLKLYHDKYLSWMNDGSEYSVCLKDMASHISHVPLAVSYFCLHFIVVLLLSVLPIATTSILNCVTTSVVPCY